MPWCWSKMKWTPFAVIPLVPNRYQSTGGWKGGSGEWYSYPLAWYKGKKEVILFIIKAAPLPQKLCNKCTSPLPWWRRKCAFPPPPPPLGWIRCASDALQWRRHNCEISKQALTTFAVSSVTEIASTFQDGACCLGLAGFSQLCYQSHSYLRKGYFGYGPSGLLLGRVSCCACQELKLYVWVRYFILALNFGLHMQSTHAQIASWKCPNPSLVWLSFLSVTTYSSHERICKLVTQLELIQSMDVGKQSSERNVFIQMDLSIHTF